MQTSNATPFTSRRVAVLGAGAAGLVTARELRRAGHHVVVFEKADRIGGIWVYDPRVEPDPIGEDPTRPIIHSSLYKSLRTNLPREAMGFMDFPFVVREGEGRDPRRFPGHREVLMYLQDFASDFGIQEMIRFECEVVSVEMIDDGKWEVTSKRKRPCNRDGHDDDFLDHEAYDAVVVCNGHFTEPRIAEIPGINLWPGKQIHSHNYRTSERFQDQVIILIGIGASAADLSIELAGVAKEVHVSYRSIMDRTSNRHPAFDNIWFHSMIKSVHEDGSVVFQDGIVVVADIILYCTGYKYHCSFLKTNGTVSVDENRIGPLYKHVFPPAFAPLLSFVGIPYTTWPFPIFEAQSKWIAGVLSGRIVLPSPDEMMEDVNIFYSTLEASGVPKHHTHDLTDSDIDYKSWLASQCQCPAFEEWRIQMHRKTVESWVRHSMLLRDEWEADHLVLQAHEDFSKYLLKNRVGNSSVMEEFKCQVTR